MNVIMVFFQIHHVFGTYLLSITTPFSIPLLFLSQFPFCLYYHTCICAYKKLDFTYEMVSNPIHITADDTILLVYIINKILL